MTKFEFLTFDDKLEAAWGLHKTANEHLKDRIDKLTAENERLRLELDMVQATILVPSQKDDRRTIERLREELVSALDDAALLREALKPFAKEVEFIAEGADDGDWYEIDTFTVGDFRAARKALGETQ